MDVKPVQPEKADPPIVVTEVGISMEVKPVQPENAITPISVTEDGISMAVKLVQPKKMAPPPIRVTELPIVSVSSVLKPANGGS